MDKRGLRPRKDLQDSSRALAVTKSDFFRWPLNQNIDQNQALVRLGVVLHSNGDALRLRESLVNQINCDVQFIGEVVLEAKGLHLLRIPRFLRKRHLALPRGDHDGD